MIKDKIQDNCKHYKFYTIYSKYSGTFEEKTLCRLSNLHALKYVKCINCDKIIYQQYCWRKEAKFDEEEEKDELLILNPKSKGFFSWLNNILLGDIKI